METRDYSKFKFLSENREIKKANVEKIKASVKEWGIIPGRPILIDGDGNIVDGQHRFIAYKELGRPIPYEVINGNVIQKTMALNSNQTQWKLQDYINSYAEQGIDCYRKLVKFEEKYKFGISASMYICFGFKATSTGIRNGKQFLYLDDAEGMALFIESIKGVSYSRTKRFIYAMIVLYAKTTFKQRELVKANILSVPQFAKVSDYLIAFENIINYKKRGENRIKL